MQIQYSWLAWTALFALLLTSGCAGAPALAEAVVQREFEAMLATVDAGQRELQQGRPEAFKALWSHGDDVTLAGGLGGPVIRGWQEIDRRLDWVATQFSQGVQTKEILSTGVSGDLAYVVQLEHLRFRVPGQEQESSLDYRVTMIFRREAGEWRIVHRHADQNLARQSPR